MSFPLSQFDQFVEAMWFSGDEEKREQVAIAGLGLTGEAGEAAEKIKKWLRGDVAAGKVTLEEHHRLLQAELGDVLFYITKLAHLHGWTLNDIAFNNYEKLHGRKVRNGTLRGSGDER